MKKHESGVLQVFTPDGSAPATEPIANKFFYALRSSTWRELPKPHSFKRVPPVVQMKLVVNDGDETMEFLFEYDHGGWYLNHRGNHYLVAFPILLDRVEWAIRSAVSANDNEFPD